MDVAELKFVADTTGLKSGSKELKKLSKNAREAEKETSQLGGAFTRLKSKAAIAGILSSLVSVYTLKQTIEYADTWSLVNSRLKLATETAQEFKDAQNDLFRISQKTRVAFEGTAELYTKLARSTKQLNLSSEQLATITETVNKTLIISGASAQSQSAGILQFTQALSAGVFRGEEFNSVLEQVPRLAMAIARGMGVTMGEFRKLSQEGKITSDVIAKSLLDRSKAVNAEFGMLPVTFSQAMTKMKNSILKTVGELNVKFGITERLAKTIGDIADHIGGIEGPTLKINRETIEADIASIDALIKNLSFGPRAGTDAVEKSIIGLQERRLELSRRLLNQEELFFREKDKQLTIIAEVNEENKKFNEESKRKKEAEAAFNKQLDITALSVRSVISESEILAESWEKASDTLKSKRPIITHIEDLKTFSTGAASAFKTYSDSAMDAASNAKSFFTGMFTTMEQSLTDFVMTGKLEFKDLANSIISDLMRIAIRQQILGPIAQSVGGMFPAGKVETQYFPTQTLYEAPTDIFQPGPMSPTGRSKPSTSKYDLLSEKVKEKSIIERQPVIERELKELSTFENIKEKSITERQPVIERELKELITETHHEKDYLKPMPQTVDVSIPAFHEPPTLQAPNKTEVNIIDQRRGNAPQVETNRTTKSDGTEVISMIIRDAVRDATSSGSFDKTFGVNFGTTRQPRRR